MELSFSQQIFGETYFAFTYPWSYAEHKSLLASIKENCIKKEIYWYVSDFYYDWEHKPDSGLYKYSYRWQCHAFYQWSSAGHGLFLFMNHDSSVFKAEHSFLYSHRHSFKIFQQTSSLHLRNSAYFYGFCLFSNVFVLRVRKLHFCNFINGGCFLHA